MVVTKLEPMSRKRYRVFIDEVFAFVLYKGELRLYQINEGQEISQEDFDKIVKELLPKRARQRALYLLQSREYTSRKLYDKLREGGYEEELSREVVKSMEEYGYVDDARYADEYIRCQCQHKSKNRIIQDLKQKGIAVDIIEHAYADWEDIGLANQQQLIVDLLKKKRYCKENCNEEERQKIMAWLYRKGFQIDDIKCAMNSENLD